MMTEQANAKTNPRFHDLNSAIVQLIDDFNMVSFLQLEARNEESVATILSYIDDCTQWAEDQEPQMKEDQEGVEMSGEYDDD
jgi:hypothetical protein